MPESIWYVTTCAVMFGSASVFFSEYSRKTSAMWVNAFKDFVALFCFALAVLFTQGWNVLPALHAAGALFASGMVGLFIGDYFLIEAYRRIGAARSLMIFSFQPIAMSIAAYFLFSEALEFKRIYAIGILILCVFIVSFEKFKEEKRWEWRGPLMAVIGVLLDTCGVLLTRYSFEETPGLSSSMANLIRCLGAGAGFFVLMRFRPIGLRQHFQNLSVSGRLTIFLACICGTFISLWFYLKAIDLGPLGPVSAIAGCVPIFSAIFECLYYKKRPSSYLIVAMSFFSVGLWILAS